MNASLKTRKWPKRIALAIPLALAAWYLLFQWDCFEYRAPDPGPCYSATHVFYITRHQTAWEWFSGNSSEAYGTARLYETAGKLMYEGKAQLGGAESGPHWFTDHVSLGGGNGAKPWSFPLPVSPGDDEMLMSCYPVQTEIAIPIPR